MERQLGQTITLDLTTHNPLTGQVSDADALPTCEVFEDATDVAIISPAVTKRVGKTGNYRVSFAITTANGFEEEKSYNVIAQAVVVGITAKSRIASFVVVKPTAVAAAGGGFQL